MLLLAFRHADAYLTLLYNTVEENLRGMKERQKDRMIKSRAFYYIKTCIKRCLHQHFRNVYKMFKNMGTSCLKHIYTIFVDVSLSCLRELLHNVQFLKTFFHHVGRNVYTMTEDVACLDPIWIQDYIMLEDMFTQCLNLCLHHVFRHVYSIFEDMFTP